MTKLVLVNIARFVGIMLFQVLILNQIELHGFITPYIYPLIILLLPFETPIVLLLIIALFTGLTIDIFSNTLGLHAAASVFMAYLRSGIIYLNRPISDYESSHRPNVKSLGLRWFVGYAGFAILFHHFFYFFIEVFSFSYLFFTLARIVCSVAVSLVLILLYEYLFSSRI